MKKVNIDQMTFEGQEKVLSEIKTFQSKSWFKKILDVLNYEVEIPLSGVIVTFACWFAIVGFQLKEEEMTYEYPIMVIESGGHYEIY